MSCSNQEIVKNIQNYSFSTNNRIGRGFSSEVYQGLNCDTNLQVAIKVIDLRKLEKDAMHELLQSEIRIIKSLSHQNIIKCENVFITVNNCYIMTQLCTDGDLASVIKKKGRLRGMQALKTMLEIAKGYAYLSNNNIIHRDIKPANILINRGTVKIADFGFAREYSGCKKQKYSVGSPLYMSPEGLNQNLYSKQGDIWSLGIVFYEILQGRTPWNPKNQKQLKQIFKAKPQIIFRVAVRDQLQDMIKRCLSYEREGRIQPQAIVLVIQNIMDEMNKNDSQSAYRQTLTRRPSYTNIGASTYSAQNSTNHETPSINKQNGRYQTLKKLQNKLSIIPKEALPPKLITNRSTTQIRLREKKCLISLSTQNLLKEMPKVQKSIEEASRYNHKILKSLINFARFTYKLFSRIKDLNIQRWLTQRIQIEMLAILKFTIQTLYMELKRDKSDEMCNCNILGIQMFKKFVETRCYSKTLLVVQQYFARYSSYFRKKQLQIIKPESPFKIPEFKSFLDFNSSSARIKQVLNLIPLKGDIQNKNDGHVLALDYLLSLVILLDMLGNENVDKFAENSQIEDIVDTTPVKRLDEECFEELALKMKIVIN